MYSSLFISVLCNLKAILKFKAVLETLIYTKAQALAKFKQHTFYKFSFYKKFIYLKKKI